MTDIAARRPVISMLSRYAKHIIRMGQRPFTTPKDHGAKNMAQIIFTSSG
jgi:hypothetical protein